MACVANVQDCLAEFFAVATVAKGNSSIATSTRYIFPLAVQILGWNHIMDNCLHTMRASLGWFPAWLADLELIVRFMRIKCVGVWV